MLLTYDVTKFRISRKCRRLVQDRFSHRGLHGIACLVIAEFKVLSDFRIRDVLDTGASKTAVGEQPGKLYKGQMIRREYEQRVPQKLVGSSTEMVEPPVAL